MSIHVLVIGAGIAGLSSAISTKLANPEHKVTILESAHELADIGAGLQLTPNATRLFKPWGIYDRLLPLATAPNCLTIRRYDGTKILSSTQNFQSHIAERYPGPFWDLHRVDLQHALVSRCEELGAILRLSSKVISVDFANAEVTIEGGERVCGDVVLCTDGLWSATRSQFLGKPSPPIPTGDLAYRITIDPSTISGPDAPELRNFIEACHVNFWAGPRTHIACYSVRGGSIFNLGLLCPDDLPPSVAKQEGNLNEMKALFEGWDPILMKFLNQVKSVLKWKLMWLEPLPEWANEKGTFLMAGDCCHPMLPYLAQGANSSLEDGAVIGALLGKVTKDRKEEQLPKLAEMYQTLRKQRGEDIQRESFRQREDFHMEDGERQRMRDEVFERNLGRREPVEDFPSRWTCPRVQRWLYGYDPYKEAEKAWERNTF